MFILKCLELNNSLIRGIYAFQNGYHAVPMAFVKIDLEIQLFHIVADISRGRNEMRHLPFTDDIIATRKVVILLAFGFSSLDGFSWGSITMIMIDVTIILLLLRTNASLCKLLSVKISKQ